MFDFTDNDNLILIVDDVPKNLQVLGKILLNEGYKVLIAQNGTKAIDIAKKTLPSLILLDVMMPEMDGYETCRQLKKLSGVSDIPIIFVTAISEAEDIVKGFEIGASDYITKPFNAAVLLARVKIHLTLYQQKKTLQTLSELDGLTKIANRRCFDNFLNQQWNWAIRNDHPIAMILIDIDYFKRYNDTYGHLQGDEVLISVAKELKTVFQRSTDLTARYGGEEFAVILSNLNIDAACDMAKIFCKKIESLQIPHKSSEINKYLTVSIGAASIKPTKDDKGEILIQKADRNLYHSKNNGRNRVTCQ